MNKLLINYLLKNFLKKFLIITVIAYGFGIILNLFEEIEFFKNLDATIFIPILLTAIFVPSLIIKLLPFIIFISSVWFLVKIRNNKELLTLKIYGFSNIKIFFILAFTSFLIGWMILFFINPITSSMVKYYEKTKSNYARDIDHLVNINKNGLWIKENIKGKERIITASKIENNLIYDIEIYELNNKFNLEKKIFAELGDIVSNEWKLRNVKIFNHKDNLLEQQSTDEYLIKSIYNHQKIMGLFNNSDTFSFVEIIINFKKMMNEGYNKEILKQNMHSMMSLPFYLFVMTAIATILTLHTMKNAKNFKFIIMGLILSVIVYYFKDLSLALGKTDRIPLILSIWTPVIALSFLTLIGVIQINEK